jgi:hypothetical protein
MGILSHALGQVLDDETGIGYDLVAAGKIVMPPPATVI